MSRRGARKGERRGGRQKGTLNKRTQAVVEASEQAVIAIRQNIPDAFEGDGHALMMAVYKDPSHDLDIRLEAAKAAAPYERPRLSAMEAKVDQETRVTRDDSLADEVNRRITGIAERAAKAKSGQ